MPSPHATIFLNQILYSIQITDQTLDLGICLIARTAYSVDVFLQERPSRSTVRIGGVESEEGFEANVQGVWYTCRGVKNIAYGHVDSSGIAAEHQWLQHI